MPSDNPQTDQHWPSPVAAWCAVAALLLAYTVGFVDRAVLTILVEPIQADLHINDTQIGLLHGFAFVIFYVTLGIPLGYVADRTNRKWLITASIAFWSVMTACCGLAGSFAQLFAARIGVGVGEAGLSPASYSMIADYFPPERRTAALGVYTIAIYLGSGLAILIGAFVLGMMGSSPEVHVPILGVIHAWQMVFIIIGLPGLVVALITMTVREPPRRRLASHADDPKPSLKAEIAGVLRQLRSHARVYSLHFIGFAFLGAPFNVALLWARPYLSRRFDLSPSEAGYMIGGLMLVFASAGILTGSILADRMQARRTDATVRVGLIGACAVLIPVLALPWAPNLASTLVILSALLFLGAFGIGAAASSLQLITPNRMRALVSALYLLVVNIVGLTAGPVITGFFTDYVFRSPGAVGFSISIVSAGAAVISAVCLFLLLRPFRDAAAHAATLSKGWEGPAAQGASVHL